MDIQNKRIPEGEFMAQRQEVLTQWPTGKDALQLYTTLESRKKLSHAC